MDDIAIEAGAKFFFSFLIPANQLKYPVVGPGISGFQDQDTLGQRAGSLKGCAPASGAAEPRTARECLEGEANASCGCRPRV